MRDARRYLAQYQESEGVGPMRVDWLHLSGSLEDAVNAQHDDLFSGW